MAAQGQWGMAVVLLNHLHFTGLGSTGRTGSLGLGCDKGSVINE